MIDWNLQIRSPRCQGCGNNFADQEVYHTLLFDERGAFARLDVCEKCWNSQYSHGSTDRKGFVSHWQGLFHAPVPRTDPIQQATAESLLRQLAEEADPKYIPVRYILAVMLERKRRLKIKSELREAGRRIFIYEHAESGDIFKIEDPELQLSQLEEVQREVGALLQGGRPHLPPPDATLPAGDSPVSAEAKPAADAAVGTSP